MTRDEAIQIARTLADKEGWPWTEPLFVEERRRFAGFGRHYWRVTTNTKYADIGDNVHVWIDDQTREVLSSDYMPPRPYD
jgi:hypothetical protein